MTAFRFTLLVLAAASSAAGAEPIVGGAGTAEDGVLVGAGGQIYARQGDAWRRRAGGGVAVKLVLAGGGSARDVWAMGATTPAYHHDGASWNAAPAGPGARGSGLLAPGGPVLVVRGQALARREGRWQELPELHGSVAAVAAASTRGVLVAIGGSLLRLDGKRWRDVPTRGRLRPDEGIGSLFAVRESAAIVAGRAGTLILVEGGRIKPIRIDQRVESFRLRVAGGAGGRVFLAGDGRLGGRQAALLLGLDGDRASLVGEVPDVGAADPLAALLAGAQGDVLLCTAGGALRARAADGTWTSGHLDDTVPESPAHATDPPAVVGP